MDKTRQTIFEQYLQWRWEKAGAITPGQKLDLLRRLRREARDEGRFPLGPQEMGRLSPEDPRVRAVLAGESVSVGGEQATGRKKGGLAEMGVGIKIGIIALIPLLLLGIVFLIMSLMKGRGDDVGTATATAAFTPVPTFTATATATALPTFTPSPTVTATRFVTPTPTPYTLALGLDEAAEGGNDPASVELSGFSFILGEGYAQDGVWQPTGAEWLAGTELRRVVAVPYSPDLANAVTQLTPADVVRLRLRSGEVVEYTVSEVKRVKRHEIEILTERVPSLAVLLYGELSGERLVVVAEAVQKAEDFVVYTPVPISGTLPIVTATAIPTITQEIITDTQVVTNTAAGLALHVLACERLTQIGEQEPPSNQRFLVCSVVLRALRDGAAYSGQALAVTEYKWIENTTDWWPQPVDITDSLGDGTLARAGDRVSGRAAGIVVKPALGKKSKPVLVWEQAGIRYIIQLNP